MSDKGMGDTGPWCPKCHNKPCLCYKPTPPADAVRLVIGEHEVLVDAEDAPFLKRFRWYIKKDKKSLYAASAARAFGKDTSILMHRLIMAFPGSEIDHKNRNGLDNRKENLRCATPKENQRNRVKPNRHGYRGVFKGNGNNYGMQIQGDEKRFVEYGFKTAEAAARRYDELSKELHGEFGIRNFKD